MSKRFGSDNFDKFDRNMNNWENSEYYYPDYDNDNDNYLEEEYEEKEEEYESRKY